VEEVAAPIPPSGEAAGRASELAALAAAAAGCTRCRLSEGRTKVVFGSGNSAAELMFVGEGPGAEEDRQGLPFVGAAGDLLNRIIQAIEKTRDEVYIANVVKCRPPGNRTPALEEANACAPYLDRQIELLAPRIIVALGKTAATRLLATEASLASLRGRVHRYREIPVIVTYHPAYLLRSLPEKAKAWEDLLLARKTLQMPVS
jgi:DNA polymerase